MSIAILAIILGFFLLTWSADKFVSGAASCARNWGISPMLIGLTIVSIGTSAPEILVSIVSAAQHHPEIAVGNALGSNIANIALVLGITALIAPIPVKGTLPSREIPLLLIVTLICGACLFNGYLGIMDSLTLLGILIITLLLMFQWQKHPSQPTNDAPDDNVNLSLTSLTAFFYLTGGLVLLLISSQILVWGATRIAELKGVSELVIGLTIVAIGTSLPEMAASLVSALRKQHDIAIGNIVGSNIFNLLAVLPMPGLIAPGYLDRWIFLRDYPVMLALTVYLALTVWFTRSSTTIGRLTGGLLIACYVTYSVLLYCQSIQ